MKTEPDQENYDSSQVLESSGEEGPCINRRLIITKECFSYCGDGIVDSGEDCDCLEGDLKCAKCCDVTKCRFKQSHFECFTGDCCNDECQVKKKGEICRKSEGNECDFEEFCDGVSEKCGEDRIVHDGVKCSDGLCWKGKCISASSQCKEIWSEESTASDEVCFNKFNVIGFENGNCLADWKNKKYEACSLEDSQCGLLNCQLGSEEPLIKSEGYFKSTTAMKGKVFECKVLSGGESAVYVAEGAPCRLSNLTDGMCVSRKCVPLQTILSTNSNKCLNPVSKKLCSGNGLCDNFQRCSCKAEWSGEFCESFKPKLTTLPKTTQTTITKTVTTTTMSKQIPLFMQTQPNLVELKSVTILSIIAGLSFVFFVLAFFSFLLCR